MFFNKIEQVVKKSFMENKNFNDVAALNAINRNFQREFQKDIFDCPPKNRKFALEGDFPIKEYHANANKLIAEMGVTSKNTFKDLGSIDFPVLAKVFDNSLQLLHVFVGEVERQKDGGILAYGFYFEEENSNSKKQLKLNLKKMSAIFPFKSQNWKMIYVIIPIQKIVEMFAIPAEFSDEQTTERLIDFIVCFEEQNLETVWRPTVSGLQSKIKSLEESACHGCGLLSSHSKLISQKNKIDLEIEKNKLEIGTIETKIGKSKFETLMIVLNQLQFTDKNGLATEKMKIAKALCSGPEVVLFTEIVSNNLIYELSYIEIPVILALMDFETKHKDNQKNGMELIEELNISENLKNQIGIVYHNFVNIKMLEQEFGIDNEEHLNFEIVECIFNWMSGFEFKSLSDCCEKLEGQILRCIFKIEKFLEKLLSFSVVFDQKTLKLTVEKSLLVIRRDILNVPSLYLTYQDG